MLAVVAVAVRVVTAVVLIAGPWTDSADELAGWDVDRFARIAAVNGRPWRDAQIEYPPGSVAIIEVLDTETTRTDDAVGVVDLHRTLVVTGLVADFAVTALVVFLGRWPAGRRYLILGLPLVPMGLLRLDLWATAFAVGAMAVALRRRRPGHGPDDGADRPRFDPATAAVGALVAAGTMVKIWPALVVPALWAVRRVRAAMAAVVTTVVVVALWLWWAGAGLAPIDQVVSLRGASGWHVESLPGAMVALRSGLTTGTEAAQFELDAYRIGTLNPLLVTAGRTAAVLIIVALAVRGRGSTMDPVIRAAAVMLGATAALIVTAPLLSPQFLLWLIPWAALVPLRSGDGVAGPGPRLLHPTLLTAVAAVLTGLILTVYGPSNVDRVMPAAGLVVRNLVLLTIPISCWLWLGPVGRTVAE